MLYIRNDARHKDVLFCVLQDVKVLRHVVLETMRMTKTFCFVFYRDTKVPTPAREH